MSDPRVRGLQYSMEKVSFRISPLPPGMNRDTLMKIGFSGDRESAMMGTTGRAGYQELWQKQLGMIRMMQATSERKALAALTVSGHVVLLDHAGQEVWRTFVGAAMRTISLADTLDVLAVDDSGNSLLIDARGQIQWKKRPTAAVYGLISADGQYIVLVTREPTVVLADRHGRVRWTYRNLLKVPAALDISASGQTVAFACRNELGEGLQAVAMDGRPYDAFMGLDPIQDIAVSADGQVTVALDRGQCIFCINCVRSIGIWKGKLNADFSGVSYADQTKQTLLYSRDGLLTILNVEGQPSWEHRFQEPLFRARLTSDGQTIWYATPEGRVGCLVSTASRDFSRLEFLDVEPPSSADGASLPAFRKVWQIDLAGGAGTSRKPLVRTWLGADQIEYALVWDGRDTLHCRNDVGDEIWTARLPAGDVADIAVAAAADLAIAVGKNGVVGFRGDGSEACRFFGNFCAAHLFASGALLLLDEKGAVQYHRHPGQPARTIETGGATVALLGSEHLARLVGKNRVVAVDTEGNIVNEIELSAEPVFQRMDASGKELVAGLRNGDVLVIGEKADVLRRANVEGGAKQVVIHRIEDTMFIGGAAGDGVTILRSGDGTRIRLPLTGGVSDMCLNRQGAVIATGIDELVLIAPDGRIQARTTFPDKILQVLPCRTDGSVYVLGESGFGKYAPGAEDRVMPSAVGFLEV